MSVTVRLTPAITKALATIAEDVWTPIVYPGSVRDPDTGALISRAEVAEVPFTAFASQPQARQVPGRLVVRRIPDLNPRHSEGQDELFTTWRYHAFFTTTDPGDLDTVAADKTHRHHAIIEQVHADLKDSALAHLPSKSFAANSAWLVMAVLAFNLTRVAATFTARPSLAKATTGTIRRRLIDVPARVASSARKLALHLPTRRPWQDAWETLFATVFTPTTTATT